MKGLTALALMIAIAAAAVGVFALVSDDEGEEQTLTYTEPADGGEFNVIGEIPEGQEEPGPGGGFTLSIPLEDAGEEVGSIQATCIITQKGGDAQCLGTAILPEGQLVLNVAGPLEDDVTGAIVGGTDEYSGAYGTFTSVSEGEGDASTDTFEFTVP